VVDRPSHRLESARRISWLAIGFQPYFRGPFGPMKVWRRQQHGDL